MLDVNEPAYKVCPVLLREDCDGRQYILAFEHPCAGLQLVKGTIEQGEAAEEATLRELAEESGVTTATIVRSLGDFEVNSPHQIWHAFLCRAAYLEDSWSHFAQDGGGLTFRFFWHPIEIAGDDRWHPIFRQALDQIRIALRQN